MSDRAFFEVWAALGAEEKRVMLVLAQRLLAGQQEYGKLAIASDPRDFKREGAEEIQDLLIYSAFETLKQQTR